MRSSRFVRIPDDDREIFESIIQMDDSDVGILVEKLASAHPSTSYAALSQQIDDEGLHLPKGVELEQIVRVLVSISQVRYDLRLDLDDIAGDLAIAAANRDLIPNEEQSIDHLVARLEALLSVKAVELTGKSIQINRRETIFINARIMTELRPVFDAGSDSVNVEGSLLVHQLQIHVHKGDSGDPETFSFALDRADLRALHEVVERALKKEASLEDYLREHKIQLFN